MYVPERENEAESVNVTLRLGECSCVDVSLPVIDNVTLFDALFPSDSDSVSVSDFVGVSSTVKVSEGEALRMRDSDPSVNVNVLLSDNER